MPAPWCAAWVSRCFGRAGHGEPRTAWSPVLFPGARSGQVPKERIVSYLDPSILRNDKRIIRNDGVRRDDENLRGLVYGIYFPGLKRIGHCEIVERVQGDFVMGIEGNTNADRDGDGVYRRTRHKRTISRYADWL
jgi:hypothetical protein